MTKYNVLSGNKLSNLASTDTLAIINRLRLLAIVAQLIVIIAAVIWLKVALQHQWLMAIIVTEFGFWLASWWRIRLLQKRHHWVLENKQETAQITSDISQWEIFFQLLFNSLALAALIFLSGGSSNPFIYFLLLDLALATIILSPTYLLLLAAIQIALYSVLHIYAPPLSIPASSPLSTFHLHLVGMWISFGVTTALIVIFGLLVRINNQRQQQQLQSLRENQIRDEQLLSIAVLAASAAHELGTPISTIATLLESYDEDDQCSSNTEVSARPQADVSIDSNDMQLLRSQVNRCREVLTQLKQNTQPQLDTEQSEASNINAQLSRLAEQWQVYRPDINLDSEFDEALSRYRQTLPASVCYALTNILDNAANASRANHQHDIFCHAKLDNEQLVVTVEDKGKGPSEALQQSAGRRLQTSSNGLGWGLFLSNASFERVGGKVSLHAAADGGTLTRVQLPLNFTSANEP